MPESVLSLVAGWCADRVLGDPSRGHPVAGLGWVAGRLERGLWGPARWRGAVFAGLLVAGAAALAACCDRALQRWPLARAMAGGLWVWACLGGKSLEKAGGELATAVASGDLASARRLLPTLAGRDPAGLDAAELCRAGIESVAENTADAVIGPLFWGAVGGLPAMAAYRAANTLDAMVGHHSERYERFGWAAARLDDLLGWAPARFGAAIAVLLAPVAGGSRSQAWATLRRDGASHPSPNAGRLEAAFAGALGVTLGGTNRYGDRIEHRPLLGAGPAPGPEALARAVRLSRATGWAAAGLASVVLGLRQLRGRQVLGRQRLRRREAGARETGAR
ncbi:MAG: cobalamin biosynthesis protein [Actinomycetota bacterium]